MEDNHARESYSVWLGRFQPYHLGHLAVTRRIVQVFDRPLALFIIQTAQNPTGEGLYSDLVNVHQRNSRNPLTLWERFVMMRIILREERLDQICLLGIPRPDAYWELASKFLPKDRVMCVTDRDEFERAKAEHWQRMGERVEIVPVTDLALELSGTAFKRALREGTAWEPFLHPAVHEYFIAIGGPDRFRTSTS